MPLILHHLLTWRPFEFVARAILTSPFWLSGLAKLADPAAAAAEMRFFGLEPAGPILAAVIATQIGGSLLVISNRGLWFGAGALAVFTALTIPIAHPFWSLGGSAAIHALHTASEHVGMMGGLAVAAILSVRSGPYRYPPAPIAMPIVLGAR